MFRDGAEKAGQVIPFSSIDSADPAELWKYLAAYEAKTGGMGIAIPHNGNLSNGLMFDDVRYTLIDTGGFEPDPETQLFEEIRTQSQLAIEEGIDIRMVQALLGHANLKTTEIYVRVSNHALRRALERVDVLSELRP